MRLARGELRYETLCFPFGYFTFVAGARELRAR
jgi:hypothetical protein